MVISMGIENVVCPRCGREALATVPSGHVLREVSSNSYIRYTNWYRHECKCRHCGGIFYAFTREKS